MFGWDWNERTPPLRFDHACDIGKTARKICVAYSQNMMKERLCVHADVHDYLTPLARDKLHEVFLMGEEEVFFFRYVVQNVLFQLRVCFVRYCAEVTI